MRRQVVDCHLCSHTPNLYSMPHVGLDPAQKISSPHLFHPGLIRGLGFRVQGLGFRV